jgi:DNA-binding transcriptional MerR regulator
MTRIGQLADATQERVRTLRYWEDGGLLEAQRTDGGYRLFPDTMVERVRFLRMAQALGLSLDEIREVLVARVAGRQPCERVRERLREHRASVRKRVRQLRALEEELEQRLVWAEAHPEPVCDAGCVYLTDAAADGSKPSGPGPRLARRYIRAPAG